jgi:pimeloyl-ACP methyl ester carboxylesterase
MSTITTTDGVRIFYKDWGSGQPIVFSHGWPLTADDWDAQMTFFLRHGYRVIAHDRRGHGRSDQPSTSATPQVAVRWLAMSLATRSASRRRRWSLH